MIVQRSLQTQVTVELKNDIAISGVLVSVDQYLNIKLMKTKVVEEERYPHMSSVRNCFIRGSVVRYVQLPHQFVDIDILTMPLDAKPGAHEL